VINLKRQAQGKKKTDKHVVGLGEEKPEEELMGKMFVSKTIMDEFVGVYAWVKENFIVE